MRLLLLATAAIGAVGCEPTLLSGKSPNVLAAEEAHAHGDAPGALRAYERALVDDELMEGERAKVALAMADVDQKSAHAEAESTYTRLLARRDLDAGTRAVALGRLVATADRFDAGGRPDEAARLYEVVLREGGASLAGRERVLGKLRRAVERGARARIEALAPQPSSMEKLHALGAVRVELHRVGASRGLVLEATRLMAVTADAAFAEADRLEREGRHAASLRFADALLAPLADQPALRAKRADLASRVGTRFETMIVGAQGYPGAIALRSGWMLRATGRAHPARQPAFDDLDRRAKAQYSVQLASAQCGELARGLGASFGGTRGVVVATRLDVGRCEPQTSESSRQEAFTYYVTESYQTTETRYESVQEYAGQDCRPTFGSSGSSSQTCSPRYVTRQVPRTETVTKQRQVPRTGYKTIVTTTFDFEIQGAVRMSAEERVVSQPFSARGHAVQTTTSGGPEGTHTEGGTADDARREAYARADHALGEARARMDAERARAWIERAGRAEQQGRELEAEDAHATALRITGATSPETRVFAQRKLGLEDDPVATLDGTALPPPETSKLALGGAGDVLAKATPNEHDAPREDEPELPGRASGRFRGSWSFLGTYVASGPLTRAGAPPLPARSGAGVAFRGELALASRLTRPLGPVLVDAARIDLALGGGTGAVTGGVAQGDEVFASGAVGWRILGGYRSESFGVFAGLDPQARTTRVSDLRMYGFVAPIAVRGEWRINGPAAIVLTGWALSPFTDAEAAGVELEVPMSRRGWALFARGEWLRMPGSFAADAETRAAASTSPETTTAAIGVGRRL